MLTTSIPSPRVPEKVKRLFIIGVNHAINLSSPLRNVSEIFTCFRNTFKTESGELEFSDVAVNGCVPRSLFYSFDAASDVVVNLAVEGSTV